MTPTVTFTGLSRNQLNEFTWNLAVYAESLIFAKLIPSLRDRHGHARLQRLIALNHNFVTFTDIAKDFNQGTCMEPSRTGTATTVGESSFPPSL